MAIRGRERQWQRKLDRKVSLLGVAEIGQVKFLALLHEVGKLKTEFKMERN